MCKERIKEIADDADMIVSGYAFKKKDNYVEMYQMWKNFGGGDFYRG